LKIQPNKEKIRKIIYITLGVILFALVTIRAISLAFTHDEASSFTLLLGDSYFLYSANHHILNTHLMDLSGKLFGYGELSLRLPNVILFLIYLFAIFLLLKQTKQLWIWLVGLSLLMFNPLLIEYFSLARGYGLSLGFMAMSIYFLLKNEESETHAANFYQKFFKSLGFGALAIWANLSSINFYIALILVFIFKYVGDLFYYKTVSRKNLWMILPSLIVASIPLSLAIQRLLILNEKEQLYFGANSLNDMITGMIVFSMKFTDNTAVVEVLKYLLIGLFLLGLVYLIVNRISKGRFMITTLLLFFVILGLLSENLLFDASYPLERTSLYIILLFSLFLIYGLEVLASFIPEKLKRAYPIILGGLTLVLLINFISVFDLNKTRLWSFDSHTRDIAKILKEQNEPYKKPTISCDWLLEPSLSYYLVSRKMPFNLPRGRGVDSTDFIYDFAVNEAPKNYKIISSYSDIGTVLYKKREN
jgi:hypothetical protein